MNSPPQQFLSDQTDNLASVCSRVLPDSALLIEGRDDNRHGWMNTCLSDGLIPEDGENHEHERKPHIRMADN